MPADWMVERVAGSVAELHGIEPSLFSRRVMIYDVCDVAVVVGSGQKKMPSTDGTRVVRRRSGGGAVLVGPGEVLWIDILLPRSDPLWNDDISVSVRWLGYAWCAALAEMEIGAIVHPGPMLTTKWSATVCFGGLGPGEVLLGGRKVVGISQRRNRNGVRFQCAALLRWRPREMVKLFDLTPPDAAVADLEKAAVSLDVNASDLSDALLNQLP
ncbi:MAG: hypothetical protein QF419_00100 [Acidimicrobiales bacterium]|nr:hypothetical protein [Acidimicrobiaceae bacterium]MDP7257750.1 hypothetical protein [Acidimicrobiales bacterium]HJO80519.1 hypothetical protein [Acidimicrobiales bacterium]